MPHTKHCKTRLAPWRTLLFSAALLGYALAPASAMAKAASEKVPLRYLLVMSKDDELCRRVASVYNLKLKQTLKLAIEHRNDWSARINPDSPFMSHFEQTGVKEFEKLGIKPPESLFGPLFDEIVLFDIYNDGVERPVALLNGNKGNDKFSKLLLMSDKILSFPVTMDSVNKSLTDPSLTLADLTLRVDLAPKFKVPTGYNSSSYGYVLQYWPVKNGKAEYDSIGGDLFPTVGDGTVGLFRWKYSFIIDDEAALLTHPENAYSKVVVYTMNNQRPNDVCYLYLAHAGQSHRQK